MTLQDWLLEVVGQFLITWSNWSSEELAQVSLLEQEIGSPTMGVLVEGIGREDSSSFFLFAS